MTARQFHPARLGAAFGVACLSAALPAAPTAVAAPAPRVVTPAAADGTPAAPARAKAHWADRDASLTADPAALVARGHRGNGNPASLVRVVSTRAVGGRPVVSVRTVPAAQAAAVVSTAQQAPGAVAVSIDSPVRASAYDDTYRSLQWPLDTLQGEQLRATDPARGVTVAVVDTGVDAAHPDLTGRVSSAGADFVTGSGNGTLDANGHGTHVAGIIAATANNAMGVAGLAPDATILPVRVLDASGSGYTSAIAQGVTYAADHGAKVINMSLGGTADDPNLKSAVAYAQNKGITVVAAAGNEKTSGNPVEYPAADAGVVGVGATDSADAVASFSNTGAYVDLTAPGVKIASTWVDASGPGYVYLDGTSMASPYVAGAVASLRGAFPSATSAQVVQALQATAKDLGAAGRDDTYGYGRIQPLSASSYLRPTPTVAWTSSMARRVYGSGATVTVQYKVNGAPLTNTTVNLCSRKVSLTTSTCAAKVTDANGVVSWTGTLTESTAFSTSYAGSTRLKPASSSNGIQVSHRLTATGGTHTLSLTVAPRAATVYVDRWNGSSWVLAKSVTTSSTGTGSATGLTAGTYRARTSSVVAATGSTSIFGTATAGVAVS